MSLEPRPFSCTPSLLGPVIHHSQRRQDVAAQTVHARVTEPSRQSRAGQSSDCQSCGGITDGLPSRDTNPGPRGCLLSSSLQNRHPVSLSASQPALFAQLVPLSQQFISQEVNTGQVRKVPEGGEDQQKNEHSLCNAHSLGVFRGLAGSTLETLLRSDTQRRDLETFQDIVS